MKIVDRKTFLAMPAGTLYSKFQPDCFDELEIKGRTTSGGDDFLSQQIAGAIQNNGMEDFSERCDQMRLAGASVPMDFSSEYRDGLYDQGQLFAVWEAGDVAELIHRLQMALVQMEGGQ